MKFLVQLFQRLFNLQTIPMSTISLDSSELENVFVDKVEDYFDSLKPEIKVCLDDLFKQVRILDGTLQGFSDAQFHSSEELAKRVESRKNDLLHGCQEFLNQTQIPERITFKNIHSFLSSFNTSFTEFNDIHNDTLNYLSQFSSQLITEFKNSLAGIDSALKRFNQFFEKKGLSVSQYNKILSLIKNYHRLFDEKNNFLSSANTKKNELMITRKELEKVGAQIAHLKEGSAFRELSSIDSERNDIKRQIKELRERITVRFHDIQKALQKGLHYFGVHDLLEEYIKDPVEAICHDTNGNFRSVLDILAEKIISQEIQLNEDLATQFNLFNNDFTREHIGSYSQRFASLQSELEILSKKLRLINVGHDLDDLQYKETHLKDKVVTLSQDIRISEENFENINIENIESRIIDYFKSSLHTYLKINRVE